MYIDSDTATVYIAVMTSELRFMTAEELAEQAGVPVRTVRYYIAEGLLPAPSGRGRGTVYTEEHLLRLRLIRLLVEQRRPLAEIRQQLAGLSIDEVRALLAEQERQAAELQAASQAPSPRAYIAALLRRRTAPAQEVSPAKPPAVGQVVPSPPAAQVPDARSADIEHSTWRRWELAPGVELHVRADAEQQSAQLIERVLDLANRMKRRPNR